MQHTSVEIEAASSALANQLAAGIKVREAVARMGKLQPKYTQIWADAAEALSRGGRLSDQLAPVWPDSVVAALKAGEESDSIPAVLKRTAQAMQVKAQVKKIYSKLMGPVGAFLAGFGVFMFFMVVVIPKLQSSLGGGESNLTFKVAILLNHLVMNFWPFLLAGLGGGIVFSVKWFKQPGNLDKLIAVADSVPQLGEAMRNLFFGLWAYQIALLASAGLPIKQQLLLSTKTLPECYQEGVILMASEVEKRGIANSADPDKQAEDDPRRDWPFYIVTALVTAHETGRVDEEMQRCAPILIDEGVRKLTQFISVADIIAKTAAATMIGIPLMAYFTQMSSSLTKAFS